MSFSARWRSVGIKRDADAGGNVQVDAGDLDRRLQRLDDPLCEPIASGFSAVRAEHQHEFVAADARHGVDLAHDAAQARGDAVQQLVTRTMTQRIVDELEAIEVEHQHGELLRVALGMHDGLRRDDRRAARGWAGR